MNTLLTLLLLTLLLALTTSFAPTPSFTTPSHLQLFTKVAETDYATELAKIEAEAKKRLDEKVKELKEKMDKP